MKPGYEHVKQVVESISARRTCARRAALSLLFLSLGLVSWLSLSPTMTPPDGFDKILHILAWCGIFLLAAPVILTPQSSFWRIAGVAAALLLCSVALELAQYFVPGRQPSFMDVLANFLGISLGLMLVAVMINGLAARATATVRQN